MSDADDGFKYSILTGFLEFMVEETLPTQYRQVVGQPGVMVVTAFRSWTQSQALLLGSRGATPPLLHGQKWWPSLSSVSAGATLMGW